MPHRRKGILRRALKSPAQYQHSYGDWRDAWLNLLVTHVWLIKSMIGRNFSRLCMKTEHFQPSRRFPRNATLDACETKTPHQYVRWQILEFAVPLRKLCPRSRQKCDWLIYARINHRRLMVNKVPISFQGKMHDLDLEICRLHDTRPPLKFLGCKNELQLQNYCWHSFQFLIYFANIFINTCDFPSHLKNTSFCSFTFWLHVFEHNFVLVQNTPDFEGE